MSELSLSDAVAEHLELQRRNRRLERRMPLHHYRDPVDDDQVAAEPPTEPVTASEEPEQAADSWWVEHGAPASQFDWE